MRNPSGRDARPFAALTFYGLHAVPTANGRFDPHYSVHPRAFAAQLDWLAAAGYRTITSHDLLAPSPDPAAGPHPGSSPKTTRGTQPRILLTFEGGDVSAYEVALPLLSARGMTAEFYIRTGGIGAPGLMNEAQIGELAARGMSVQSRAHTSRSLAELDGSEVRDELRVSRQRLEGMTGQGVHGLALPSGRAAGRVRRVAVDLGYRTAVTSSPGRNDAATDPLDLHRLVVDRHTDLRAYASLVCGRGFAYHAARVRHGARPPQWLAGNRRHGAGHGVLRAGLRTVLG